MLTYFTHKDDDELYNFHLEYFYAADAYIREIFCTKKDQWVYKNKIISFYTYSFFFLLHFNIVIIYIYIGI